MKTILIVLLGFGLFAPASAKVLRVGSFGPPIANVDYSTLNDAITAAANNDTIYCFPGSVTNTSHTINKKLTLIGYGSWLSATTNPKGNANQQAFAGSVMCGTIVFEAGSSGSTIMGFDEGTIFITEGNDIVIRRNKNLFVYLGWNLNDILLNNIQISENFLVAITYGAQNMTVTNLLISNNLIHYLTLTNFHTYSGIISNNIWARNNFAADLETVQSDPTPINLAAGAFLFQNNVLASYTDPTPANNYNYFYIFEGGNTVFNHNVMIAGNNEAAFPPAGTGNVVIQANNAANLFEGFPNIGSRSVDDRWVLKAGSPALAANRPGSTVNAGIYGGANPYKLSTIPPIPTIYQLTSPSGSTPTGTSIQINVSTRSNN